MTMTNPHRSRRESSYAQRLGRNPMSRWPPSSGGMGSRLNTPRARFTCTLALVMNQRGASR